MYFWSVISLSSFHFIKQKQIVDANSSYQGVVKSHPTLCWSTPCVLTIPPFLSSSSSRNLHVYRPSPVPGVCSSRPSRVCPQAQKSLLLCCVADMGQGQCLQKILQIKNANCLFLEGGQKSSPSFFLSTIKASLSAASVFSHVMAPLAAESCGLSDFHRSRANGNGHAFLMLPKPPVALELLVLLLCQRCSNCFISFTNTRTDKNVDLLLLLINVVAIMLLCCSWCCYWRCFSSCCCRRRRRRLNFFAASLQHIFSGLHA